MAVQRRLFVSAGEFLPDFICVGVGEADAVHIHHHDKFGSCRMLDIQCIIPELFSPFLVCIACATLGVSATSFAVRSAVVRSSSFTRSAVWTLIVKR